MKLIKQLVDSLTQSGHLTEEQIQWLRDEGYLEEVKPLGIEFQFLELSVTSLNPHCAFSSLGRIFHSQSHPIGFEITVKIAQLEWSRNFKAEAISEPFFYTLKSMDGKYKFSGKLLLMYYRQEYFSDSGDTVCVATFRTCGEMKRHP